MFGVYFVCLLYLMAASRAQELNNPFASVSTSSGQSTIVEGDTVVLKCVYYSDSVIYVEWYYSCENPEEDCDEGSDKMLYVDNEVYPSDSNGTNAWKDRAFGEKKSDGYYITLKNVKISDDRFYVCKISDNQWGLGGKPSNTLNLVVTVKPSAGVLQRKDNLYTFAQERSNFTCVVDRVKPPESASVVWYLDQTKVRESQDPAYARLNADGKTYTILSSLRKSFSPADNGKVLRCVVKWVVENHIREEVSSDGGELTVYFPPQWSAPNNTVYAEVNSEVTMTCHVTASPLPSQIHWQKRGYGDILHRGESFTFNKVTKADFTLYVCVADNGVGPPIEFDVNLKESGRPHLLRVLPLPNTTSSTVTLSWLIGSDGGHPPLTYSVSRRVKHHQTFHSVSESIPQAGGEGDMMQYDVTGLHPNTMYEFEIIARNSRKQRFPKKADVSEAMVVEAKTKVEPLIEITKTKLTEDSLDVEWDYSSILHDLNRNYEVSLKIKYGKSSEFGRSPSIYPRNNTIRVTLAAVSIPGQFDVSAQYSVVPVIYENDQVSTATPAVAHAVRESNMSFLLPVIIVPIAVVAIAIIVVVCLCCRRRGPLMRRKSTGHKRYNGEYMLERDIYEELNKVKTKPPKLPSRNNSLNEPMSPMRQSNNITAIQTMYLTQYPRPSESDGGASGEIPLTPPPHSEAQPSGREGTDYLVPVNTSMQITVNQSATPPPPAPEYEKEKRLANISEEEKSEIEKLMPAPTENHYLPMCKE